MPINNLLPISGYLPQISSSLATGKNLIIQAEPGAGKSTALPISLLQADWLQGKKILMLEPRRVAAKSIAHYLAEKLGEKVGQSIGYQIKNDRKVSGSTVLEIVTEGILTRRIQSDPELAEFALIIFDEFHERSIHADLSLMLTVDVQQTIREDLKILVMSATLDTALVSSYLGDAEVIECPGRAYPVSVNYVKDSKDSLIHRTISALQTALKDQEKGDVLVFLPGQAEIRRCIAAAGEVYGNNSGVTLLPLHGGLPVTQQEMALSPDPVGRRRIIFATNIAETSLTIEGVTCVVDSGLEKVLRYDPASFMTRLETVTISKASAEQRRGRAGRLQEGSCIRLWSEVKQHGLTDFQTEEIRTADLTGFLLELFLWGENDYSRINWLTPPPESHFDSAKKVLLNLGLIDETTKITELGRKSVALGLTPRLAAILLQAKGETEKGIACELAALLSAREIFLHQTGTDIVDRLLALQEYKVNRKAALKDFPIERESVESTLVHVRSLRTLLQLGQKIPVFSLDQLHDLSGRLLLFAYPDRLAKQRAKNDNRYLLANGKGAFLLNEDPLFDSEWLVVADCDAQKREARIFRAAPVSFDDVVERLGDRFTQNEQYDFDSKKEEITGYTETKFGAIPIKSATISKIPSDKFRECLHAVLRERGLGVLNWTDRCADWISRAEWLGTQLEDFPAISTNFLIENLHVWLLPYISGVKSIADLKKVNTLELLASSLSWQDQQRLDREAPTLYETPSGRKVPIVYDSQHGPTVSVVLQEMFGEIESPKIAEGKVSIKFQLLSPAHRPIQTTSDLGNFWNTSYFEVIKDMKNKYPKHRWPDKPLVEKPGRSIKKR